MESTIHLEVPKEIHVEIKVMAAKRQKSMKQYIIDLIQNDIAKSKEPMKPRQSLKSYPPNVQKPINIKKAKFVETEDTELTCPRHHVPLDICKAKH